MPSRSPESLMIIPLLPIPWPAAATFAAPVASTWGVEVATSNEVKAALMQLLRRPWAGGALPLDHECMHDACDLKLG